MLESQSITAALALIENDPSKIIQLTVNGKKISPGDYVPRADAQSPPEISFSVSSSTGRYLVIGLDLDAPFQSWTALSPILHWIQPGLKPDNTDSKLVYDSKSDPFIANYIGPAPPPGSGPHRYTFFLYEQPTGFDASKWAPKGGKELGTWNRMRYNLDRFEKEAGLKRAVGVNYFTSN